MTLNGVMTSKARNQSLKYVQGNWVLVLDADVSAREIPLTLKQAIKRDHYLVINPVRQEVQHNPHTFSFTFISQSS